MISVPFNDVWFVTTETPGQPHTVVGPLSVPHDAMIKEPRNGTLKGGHHSGYYPGGLYRYSKTIRALEEWKGKVVVIQFESVYHRSKVYVNGTLAGGHPNGYIVFHVEIHNYLLFDNQPNLIEVVVDNQEQPTSRWYPGSGIYRPVHLLVGSPIHIKPFGVRVTTVSMKENKAVVRVTTSVVLGGDLSSSEQLHLSTTLVDGDTAHILAKATDALVTDLSSGSVVVSQEFQLDNTNNWSLESPTLHQVVVKLMKGGAVIDLAEDTFGIRMFQLGVEQGFQVNGETVLLRGACIHHDSGVIGATTLEAGEDRRIRILKEAGFNAIRSSHNSISMAHLRACDKYGVLVMDELTDVWFQHKTLYDYASEFEDWWERDFDSLIAKDYNHPSVFMYSLGNEILETGLDWGIKQGQLMAKRVKEMDPTRYTTNSINGFLTLMISTSTPKPDHSKPVVQSLSLDFFNSYFGEGGLVAWINWAMSYVGKLLQYVQRLSFLDSRTKESFAAVDVAGYNYMIPRYAGDIKLHPNRIVVGSETGVDELSTSWPLVEKYSQIIGDFVWTGWDYIGEAGIAAPYYNQTVGPARAFPAHLGGEPFIDITGYIQPQAYKYQIIWHLRLKPYIAVRPLPHTKDKLAVGRWRTSDAVRSWSWEGYEGEEAVVEVYSHHPKVELLLNGKRVSVQPAGAANNYTATFKLPYQPGTLAALGLDELGNAIAKDELVSANPNQLQLTVLPEVTQLKADGQDIAFIAIELTDKVGVKRFLADRAVSVVVEGAGVLEGFGSANPVTDEGFTSTTHLTYFGRAQAIVRAGLIEGSITVTVTAEECNPVRVELKVVAV